MADRLNPVERSVAESDYEKKFNRRLHDKTADSQELKEKESDPDVSWREGKLKYKETKKRKGAFRFAGRHAGKVRKGSAFVFVVALIAIGVWYSSIFAPNILLVNIKEMYTNDLADATIALDTYYKKLMNYKIGRPQCGDKKSIKCKLSTMSRAQKMAFQKQGFIVIGAKVEEDNLDDGQPENDKPESRYQVAAIIPPIQSPGLIATGDMLFLYAAMSSANKALVYNVFNPKSGFFLDTRFKQVLKSRYNLTKSLTTGGSTEQQVNRSFDNSVRNGGSIDKFGRPGPNGVSLGSLSSPLTLAQLEAAMALMVGTPGNVNSFVGLQCVWYSFGKAVTNNAKSAKAATLARFAMQYLKAADAIKAGWADEVSTNVLAGKLAESTFGGGYTGPNATDSSMYKSIVYGSLPIPSIFGLLYYLDTFDLIAALVPAWSQIMASAAAQGTASNVPGQLAMPPANLTGSDREYCLEGETLENHTPIKDTEKECVPQVEASAPPGWQGALESAIETAQETCPVPHYDEPHRHFHGEGVMQPSLKETATILSPYVAGIFGVNVMAWANIMSLLFTSQTKGVAASDALFAGTGQILGDMAMSRGMMPSNALFMAEYLALKDEVQKEYDEVARYNARQNPLDPYNKFSFVGSILRKLRPVTAENSPLFGALANVFTLVRDGFNRLNPSADAIYYLQPSPFNPLRLSCPDPEYLAIMIMADTACNVRYSFSRLELAVQIDMVLDYMTKSHPDVYQEQIDELIERQAKADPEGDSQNVARMLATVEAVANQPFIDEKTGRAIPNSEYDKFLQYCVNRQDPWGRSAIHVQYTQLPDEEIRRRRADKLGGIEPISPYDRGDPYENLSIAAFPAITEGASSDQDWYSGKKCTEQSEMLTYFRAYTMICSVDGTLSGALDCTHPDNQAGASYLNPYFMSNDILYTGY